MPLNLIKRYSNLLEIAHLNPTQRKQSLMSIFQRDIENNANFKFRDKVIRPIKNKDGEADLQVLFDHLTTKDEEDERGNKTGRRLFEMTRSERLHWIKYHIEGKKVDNISIFSCDERIEGVNLKRTYIHDADTNYLIILEPYRTSDDYYLITAYYINEKRGEKQLASRIKKKLPEIY